MKKLLALVLTLCLLLPLLGGISLAEEKTVLTFGSIYDGEDWYLYRPFAEMLEELNIEVQFTKYDTDSFAALLQRKLPRSTWDRQKLLTLNDTVSQMSYAKNPIARLAYSFLSGKVKKAIAKGKPDLNLLFIYNIPFRGMAKMMNGMVSMDMAQDILKMVNGHWHKGLFNLIHHYFHRPKLGA